MDTFIGGLMGKTKIDIPVEYIKKRREIALYLRRHGVSRTSIWALVWKGWVTGKKLKLMVGDSQVKGFIAWRAIYEKDYQDQLFQEEREKGV